MLARNKAGVVSPNGSLWSNNVHLSQGIEDPPEAKPHNKAKPHKKTRPQNKAKLRKTRSANWLMSFHNPYCRVSREEISNLKSRVSPLGLSVVLIGATNEPKKGTNIIVELSGPIGLKTMDRLAEIPGWVFVNFK